MKQQAIERITRFEHYIDISFQDFSVSLQWVMLPLFETTMKQVIGNTASHFQVTISLSWSMSLNDGNHFIDLKTPTKLKSNCCSIASWVSSFFSHESCLQTSIKDRRCQKIPFFNMYFNFGSNKPWLFICRQDWRQNEGESNHFK